MSNTPDSNDDDQLGLTEETLDQWENELDEFAVQIMQRLKLLSDTETCPTPSDESRPRQ
jgi:hypothetical protein